MGLSVVYDIVASGARLILPGLGAFLVRDSEAGFDVGHVSFSPFLRYNDGKLEQGLERTLGLTPPEARSRAVQLVEEVKRELDASGSCLFPRLGILRREEGDLFTFIPITAAPEPVDSTVSPEETISVTLEGVAPAPSIPAAQNLREEDMSLNVSAAAPAPVQEKELPSAGFTRQGGKTPAPETPVKKMETPAAPRPTSRVFEQQRPQKRSSSFTWIFLVLLLLFAVLGADYLWFGRLTPALLSLFQQDEVMVETVAEENFGDSVSYLSSANDTFALEEHSLGTTAETALQREYMARVGSSQPAASEPLASTSAAPRAAASARQVESYSTETHDSFVARAYPTSSDENIYHIVLGSFRNSEYAMRFSDKLSDLGFASEIIEQPSGMYAVAVGSFSERSSASSVLANIRTKYPQAWILEY